MTDDLPDDITLIPEPSKQQLTERKTLDYKNHRQKLAKWLLTVGKNPDKAEPYSKTTAKYHLYRIDKFYRWIWEQNNYTTDITHSHADQYMEELAYSDHSNSHKDKCQQAVKVLFKYRKHKLGGELWNPEMTFSTETYKPQDYFTIKERKQLREAALEYSSIPGYNDLTPEERSRWKAYLAQRFQKPKSQVSPDDWKKANGWKIPSLVWVSLDTGLRPVEVERAVTSWVELDNGVLRIPKEESSKTVTTG
jgi:hypothetical protein